MNIKRVLAGIVLLLSLIILVPAHSIAIPVDLELVLAVDVSSSIDDTEFKIQKAGYVNAFKDDDIINGITTGGTYKSIAVTFVYWSSEAKQEQAVDWMQIDSGADSIAFAEAIDATTRPFENRTGIGAALTYSANLFSSNGFEGDRNVIDVSGDGVNNEETPSDTGRRNALNAGVTTINGLVFDSSIDQTVFNHYRTDVIGGADAFAILATEIDDFGEAVKDKLAKEITGQTPVPEPATLLLLGAGLCGLAGIRRRFK